MIGNETWHSRLASDAEAIKRKYGAMAEIYAESRSEAAGMAGNCAGEQHWQQVAGLTEEDDQ